MKKSINVKMTAALIHSLTEVRGIQIVAKIISKNALFTATKSDGASLREYLNISTTLHPNVPSMYKAVPCRHTDMSLFSQRHILHLVAQCSPVVGLQLCILDSLLAPILVQFANVVL